MPLTAAERQRKRRQKLRDEGKYKEYRDRQNEMNMKCRDRKKLKEHTLPQSSQSNLQRNKREAVRKRVAKFRALKKVRQLSSPKNSTPFTSAVAFGKATTRAKRALHHALPSTPTRKKAVMCKLYDSIQATVSPIKDESDTTNTHKNSLPAEHTEAVKSFYERDDISRQAPGRKDLVTVRAEDGSKAKYQTLHLTSSLKETHALYQQEFPKIKISKSKFAELRPQHVLLSSKLPHNVCLCRYHENFIMAINALHTVEPAVPLYTNELPQNFLCDPPRRECWFNECENCCDGKGFRAACTGEQSSPVSWSKWEKNDSGILSKIVEGNTHDLIDYIAALIPKFMEHCFFKRMQAAAYNDERHSAEQYVNSNKALLQVDFSENYTCISQDEIQSAHWQQAQVSPFTAALWHTGSLHPIVLTSDNLTHSKDTVVAYIDCLLDELPENIKNILICSDGPASQFKNRYILAALKPLEEKHDVQITWNFFATSHGKGPVDGIGGAVKRVVWNAVRSRKNIVNNAASFTTAAGTSNVKVVELKPCKLESINEDLSIDEVFREATSIPRIAGVHCMK